MALRNHLKKLFLFLLLTGCTSGGLGPVAPLGSGQPAVTAESVEDASADPLTQTAAQAGPAGTTLPVISSTPGSVLCKFGLFVVHVPGPKDTLLNTQEICLEAQKWSEEKQAYLPLEQQDLDYWTQVYHPGEKKWITTPHCGEDPVHWGVFGAPLEYRLFIGPAETWHSGPGKENSCPPIAGIYALEARYLPEPETPPARGDSLTPGMVINPWVPLELPDPIELVWEPPNGGP